MNRKTFVKKSLLSFAGISVISSLYTWKIEPYWLEFVHHTMSIKNLPKHLEGKTLMQISDIHVGKRFDHQYLIESLKKAKSYNPDFVVYTGDYITLHEEKVLFNELTEVLNHAVLGKLGTIGILGNHDYGINWKEPDVAEQISNLLTSKGIEVLRNQHKEFSGLNFTGIDDIWGTNFDPELVLKNINSQKANIVLCHNPDVCDLDVWHHYQGWILSGHTHGGQCKPPFLPPPILPVKNKIYSSGKIKISNNRTLYINRALGHMFPIRFNVRPEITIFTLEKEI